MKQLSSYETVIAINPQLSGFLAMSPENGPTVTLQNARQGIALEMQQLKALNIIKSACKPLLASELIRQICTELEISESEARLYMESLIESRVVLEAKEAQRTIWENYNRKEAAHFYFRSRGQEYLDEQAKGESAEIRKQTLSSYLIENPPPPAFKHMSGPSVVLPPPSVPRDRDLAHLLLNRKTVRKFSGVPITIDILSGLLKLSLGRTRAQRLAYQERFQSDPTVLLQSLFCAFEFYLCIHRVTGLAPGVYHYDLKQHALTLIRSGETEDEVFNFIWGQPMARKSAVSFFISTVFERYAWRYRYSKAYGNLLVSLGECAQALIMAASAYELGSCMTPALRDQDVDAFIGLDRSSEQAMYYLGIGPFDSKVSQVVS